MTTEFYEGKKRYTLFPIVHQDVQDLYEECLTLFWSPKEIDITQKDMSDFEKLTQDERHYIKMILCFFSSSDSVVNENLCLRFMQDFNNVPEVLNLYGFQYMIENVHSQVYSLLIDSFIRDPVEKRETFEALDNFECVKLKFDWAQRYLKCSLPLSERLVAFACVEHIFFCSSFAGLLWVGNRGLMSGGLIQQNELIRRDEFKHVETAVLLFKKLNKKPSNETIIRIIREAVAIEEEFIEEAIPCRFIGMNEILMKQYIRYNADKLSKMLIDERIYNETNPFPYMEQLVVESKTNFFDRKNTNYIVGVQKVEELNFDSEF